MTSATILYIPHGGGPLPLLNDPGHANINRFLRGYPASIAKPDAIVVISAHWEETVIAITAAQAPPLLFDYFGFPPETYEYRYPAPGHPELAERIHRMLLQAGIDARLDHERGLDHGVFVPLLLMYPDAGIPCIQISLSASLDAAVHVRIGKALSMLKHENLLILGSGSSFHNIQVIMSRRGDRLDERNRDFEAWLVQTLSDKNLSETKREELLTRWELAPQARYCHPREEHLLPLHVCYGMAQQAADVVFQEPIANFLTSAYQWHR